MAHSETTEPVVSIIIPVFNGEEYVARAIESALNQTLKEVEVIVVDDGSTDGTPDVLKSFEGHIVDIRQENGGVAAALNTGIRASQGKYVCFLGSDDTVMPNKAELQATFLDKYPEVGLCYGAWQRRDISGILHTISGPSWLCDGTVPQDELVYRLVQGTRFPASSPLIRGRWLRAVGGHDESLRSCVDLDLWWRLAAAGCAFRGIDEVVTLWWVRPMSLSKDPELMHRMYLRVLDKYFRWLGPKVPEGLERREKSRAYATLGAHRIRLGRIKKGQEAWESARALRHEALVDVLTWRRTILRYLNPLHPNPHPEGLPDYRKTWHEVGSILRAIVRKQEASGKRAAGELSAFAFALSMLAFSKAKGWRARRWLARALLIRPLLLFDPSLLRSTAKIVLGPALTPLAGHLARTLTGAR